jgi:hypothetical protein
VALSVSDETVAHICHRLDGMPLAIELAAARLSAMSLNEIAARLDDRFGLLAGNRRGALPRHQTLRALIDWSYDALSEQEKIAFRRLGVFIGGWELEQANIVTGVDALPVLTRLASKSLVVMEEHDGVTRYRYLETIREYALEELAKAGEVHVTRHRHSETFMQLAEESTERLHGAQQRIWLGTLERDYPNLQASMEWCLELDGDPLTGCCIVGALFHFWYIASRYHQDARRWALAAKQMLKAEMPYTVQAWVLMNEEWFAGDMDTAEARSWLIYDLFVKAGDLVGAAMVKTIIGRAVFYTKRDYPLALHLSEEGVEEARLLGADWELRFNLIMLGECLRFAQHDPARAEATYRESMALSRVAGDINDQARSGIYASGFAMERLDFAESLRCAEEVLAFAQQTEDVSLESILHREIAENLFCMGAIDRAITLVETNIAFSREWQLPYGEIAANVLLARIALFRGDHTKAHVLLTEALTMRRAATKPGQFLTGAHVIMDAMAALAAAQDHALRAVRLRGIADRFFELNHQYRWANVAKENAPYMSKSRAALGDEVYEAAYAEGRAMTLEQAIAYALNA